MSNGLNKVMLIGNLGKDVELRYSPSGVAVANLAVATSETWKDKKTGQPNEKTEWHRVVMFDRLAEIAGEYLKKGSKVYIEGQLQTRKWQDKEGNDRYSTEIRAREMQMLGAKSGATPVQAQGGAHPPTAPATGGALDDDIPFNRLHTWA